MEGATLPLLKGAGGEKHFDAEGGKSHRPRQIYRGWEEKDEEEEEGYRSTESSANPDPIIVPLIFFPLSFFLFTNREEEERYRAISSTIERKFFEILVVRPRYVRDTLSLSPLISLSRRRSPPEVREEKKEEKRKKEGEGSEKLARSSDSSSTSRRSLSYLVSRPRVSIYRNARIRGDTVPSSLERGSTFTDRPIPQVSSDPFCCTFSSLARFLSPSRLSLRDTTVVYRPAIHHPCTLRSVCSSLRYK